MQTKLLRLSKVSACALLASNALPTFAQSAGENETQGSGSEETVVVVGRRAGLASAQAIRQERIEIVDSVVADDINKLPDINVTEALQRVTGVQILRDRGEGAGVAIRGLTQMETTLNGREIFTAGTGRNLDFADIPAEMVSGIDVYKTSSANQIEGGIGGTIDLRTRRPFDFAGREIVVSGRSIYGDLVNRSKPQFSLLASNRWQFGGGEFGALINLAYQERAWREDQKNTGNPVARNDLVAGRTVVAPNGTSETTSVGERKRTAGTVVLQWRPSDALEFYAEGSYAEFKTFQDSYQINAFPLSPASPTFVAGSPSVFSGTNDLRSITWTNTPLSVLTFARDTVDWTKQAAVGGSWTDKALIISSDVSYTESYNSLFFSNLTLSGTAANFRHDLSSDPPRTRVSGTDLGNPASFQITGINYVFRPFNGDLTTARLDAEYELFGKFIESISAGVRYAKRGATNAPGQVVASAVLSGISAESRPDLVQDNPYAFFDGEGTHIRDFVVGNPDLARNPAALRRSLGITAPIPASGNPLSVWNIDEETQAAYAMSKFDAKRMGMPLDGNLGLRIVRTREVVSGSQSIPTSGAVSPIKIGSTYTDVLPSLNLRYRLNQGLHLRAAASKSITRPNFDQLSPSLVLTPNAVNPAQNIGSAGNPELKPVRADNVDLAVEKYFNRTTSAYVTGFWKKVDGFVTTVSNPEFHDGAFYQVSRPQNSASADIKGFEVGYQQFYDFLPGWLSGLGLQANYTYIDSETLDSALGEKVPLQNLSKHSYNLVGMYEKGKLSVRIAYNWRDKFLSGVANIVGVGALPIYTKAYGWLDASATYRFSSKFSVAIEGTNLLHTIRSSYYGVETRPQGSWINDMQISAIATVRF